MSTHNCIIACFLQYASCGGLYQHSISEIHTIVILFFRGLICLAEDGAVGSSEPLPPKLLARFLPLFLEADANSFRSGLGWSGTFSAPLRLGVPGINGCPPSERLVDDCCCCC